MPAKCFKGTLKIEDRRNFSRLVAYFAGKFVHLIFTMITACRAAFQFAELQKQKSKSDAFRRENAFASKQFESNSKIELTRSVFHA